MSDALVTWRLEVLFVFVSRALSQQDATATRSPTIREITVMIAMMLMFDTTVMIIKCTIPHVCLRLVL